MRTDGVPGSDVDPRALPYLEVCLKALAWAKERDYTGYSKFDALNSPLLKRLTGKRRLLRGGVTYLVSRAPFNVRPLLGVQKRQNPNGLALFARAYFNLSHITGETSYADDGLALLERLLELSRESRYGDHCWGYCHDWEMGKFFVPQYEPNAVVTTFVARAFLDAYGLTGRRDLFDVAESSTRFCRKRLHATLDQGDMRSYSYTPFDHWTAVNVSALIAGLFALVYAESREAELASEAARITNFVLDRQTDEGGWYHADPPEASHRKIDNYQMAFILESLLALHRVFGDDRVGRAYERGLEFYSSRLFLENGAPKFEAHRTFPHDILASSQGILVFAHDSSRLDRAELSAQWALDNMWDPEGRFYFQKGRFLVKRYTLMRWCQAWMCYALSELTQSCDGPPGNG